MPVIRTYRCPDCEGKFEFYHRTSSEPPPAHCELCKAPMFDTEPELPRINIGGSDIVKSVDQVYAASEQSLGVTDMKDSLREGEPAAKMPLNTVTRVAAQMGHNFWGGGSPHMGSATDMISASRGTAQHSLATLSSIQTSHKG